MAKKKDLGKGIRALINNIEEKGSKQETAGKIATVSNTLNLDWIEPNPYQPRQDFDPVELDELSQSIKIHGLIQPITVKKITANKYYIISGERRFRASKLAGLTSVPVYVREAGDQEMLELALIENIQRAELNPLDIAISYQRLISEFELTHDNISKRVGKERSTISNYLRVLKLTPSAQEALKSQKISLGHAKVLASVEDTVEQLALLEKILTNNLSVRAAEREIAKPAEKGAVPSPPKKSAAPLDDHLKKLLQQVNERIGTKVHFAMNNQNKGKLEIKFDSASELERILDVLLDQ